MQTKLTREFQLNAEVRAVVEAHGLDWDAFRNADYRCYEQQLARHAPDQLDQLLTLLLTPGISFKEMAAKSPPWPPNTELAGMQPTRMALSRALRRWNAARALDSLPELNATVEKFRAKLDQLPSAQTGHVTDVLCSVLSHELFAAKLEGTSLSGQTKALAQLLRKQKLQLDEQSLGLKRAKFEFDATEACLAKLPELKEVSNGKMSEEEKNRAIQAILFPAKNEEVKMKNEETAGVTSQTTEGREISSDTAGPVKNEDGGLKVEDGKPIAGLPRRSVAKAGQCSAGWQPAVSPTGSRQDVKTSGASGGDTARRLATCDTADNLSALPCETETPAVAGVEDQDQALREKSQKRTKATKAPGVGAQVGVQASACGAGNTLKRELQQDLSPRRLLLPYQDRWVDDTARFKIGVMSRQTGKSFSTACEAVVDCINDPGTKWVCLSAGERQALEWLEKAGEWSTAFKSAIEAITEDRDDAEALLKQAEIRFKNGSRIIAIPANPSTARGYSANVILDEFGYHEDPDAIWAAMFPSQTNPLAGTFQSRVKAMMAGEDTKNIRRNLKLRVVSTFNGRDNKFHSLWEKREQNGYSGHLVDIHTAVKEGLPLDINALKAGLDDPEIWAQEYECVPADVSAVLLPYDLLAACESTEATTTIDPAYFNGGKPFVLGIDFARKRDLSVAWTDELVGDVTQCREVLEMRGLSTPDQVELLRPRIRAARRVCLDYTGPGVGMGDYLVKEFGEYNPGKDQFGKIELCTFTNTLKVEIFSKLKMVFEQRRTRIPVSRVVREDLHSVQRMTGSSGTVTYRAPHSEDGHADRCTAKALAQRAAGLNTAKVAYARPTGLSTQNNIGRLGMGKVKGAYW